MYLGLQRRASVQVSLRLARQQGGSRSANVPFGRGPFLLDMSEHTLSLVAKAMRASRRLCVALDLLLPAHVASLRRSYIESEQRH